MSDLKPSPGVLWGRLAWHPAVKAWLAFAEGAGEPDTIEVLREWHIRRDSGTRAGGEP